MITAKAQYGMTYGRYWNSMEGLPLSEGIAYLLGKFPLQEIEVWDEVFEVPLLTFVGWDSDSDAYTFESDPGLGFSVYLKMDGRRIDNNSCEDWWEACIIGRDFILSTKSQALLTFNGYYGLLPLPADFLDEVAQKVRDACDRLFKTQ